MYRLAEATYFLFSFNFGLKNLETKVECVIYVVQKQKQAVINQLFIHHVLRQQRKEKGS